MAPYSLVDIIRRCGGSSVNVCRARWRHSAETATSSHHHGNSSFRMHCPSFRHLFHVQFVCSASTITAHFTRIAYTRRDASQRTARVLSISSDPETVPTVVTASHLATSEPQKVVPRLSETDQSGTAHPSCIIPSSLCQYSEFQIKIVLP